MEETVSIIEKCPAKCYIEGELIVLDAPIVPKPFNEEIYNRYAP